MARSPRGIVIGAILAPLAAVLIWKLAFEPPQPETAADTVSAAITPKAPMPKAIATPGQPAILTVAPPPVAATRSARMDSALQLTVRPENAEKDRPYLVNVYTVPKDGKPKPAPKSADKDQDDPNYVGSFSFFPPPSVGVVRTFTLPT